MRKLVSIIVLIIMVTCSAFAFTGCEADSKDKAQGLQYKKYDGELTVTAYEGKLSSNDGVLDIDKIAREKNVTFDVIEKIAKHGEIKDITEIVIPNSVKRIEKGAFAKLPNLKKITVPFIGETAIADAELLETPSSDKSVNEKRLLCYWFGTESFENDGGTTTKTKYEENASELTYYLPANLKTIEINANEDYVIPAYACYGVKVLETVIINDNVKGFGQSSFENCTYLTTIKKGDVVIDMSTDATLTKYDKAFEGTKIVIASPDL